MTALGGLIAGSVVAVALAGFKAIERSWARKDQQSGKGVTWSPMDRERLNTMSGIVTRCDAEGVPLAYVPRRLIKLSENQTDLMRTLAELAKEQTALSERLYDHMTAHESREEEELKGIRTALEQFAT